MTRFRETRLIVGLCLCLICVVWVVVAVLTEKARHDAIVDGYREAFTSASVFAEQATRTIRLLDSVSQLVAHDLARSPNPNRLKELVDEKAISMDTLVLLSFIDAEGRAVSSNYGPDPSHTDLSDREHVRVQLDHKVDGLYIGKPVLGRVSGKWSIQLSRRVEDGAGHTLGVLVFSIDPHYFERFWSRVTEPSQTVTELIGLDGVLRSRSVDVESSLQRNTRRDALAGAARDAPSGRLETRDDDGRIYLTEFVRLEELPLFVTASVLKSAALGESNVIVTWLVGLGFALSTLIALFALILASLIERLRTMTDQAQTAERRLADAIEAIPEGFALFDPEDRLVVCNTAYREVYSSIADRIVAGVRFEDLVRHGLECGQYPEAEGQEEKWLATRLADHRSASGQIEQRTNTGRWLRIDEKRTSEGGVVGIRYDITELKQRELAFARQTSILDMTLQNIGEAVAAFDSARRLVGWNDNCSRLLDLPPEMFKVGQSFDALVRFHAERGGFAPLSPKKAVTRLATDFHVPLVRVSIHRVADGRSIEARRYPTPDGGAVFVYRDISERAEYEERRDEALRAAESANRTKSEFLAMISHEIRTPMNAIIGMTSVLAERDLGPTERRYVDVIAESGEKLLVIIDDLLDLSSLEAGKFMPVKSVFDICSLVENAVDTARALPQAGKLSIVADIDCAAPAALVADAVRIRQIVLNLLTNAVKYAGRGVVTIRVSTTRTDNAAIMLRWRSRTPGRHSRGASSPALPAFRARTG